MYAAMHLWVLTVGDKPALLTPRPFPQRQQQALLRRCLYGKNGGGTAGCNDLTLFDTCFTDLYLLALVGSHDAHRICCLVLDFGPRHAYWQHTEEHSTIGTQLPMMGRLKGDVTPAQNCSICC